MTPESRAMTERELFEAALELAPGDRAAFLDGACEGDAVLRERLEALLHTHDQAGSFLEQPAVTGAFPADAGSPDVGPPAEAVGQVLAGRYQLLEALGEGGMGTVWMAQQTEPVKRLVAVKLIKAGMDSKAVLARFEAERQALALMDHPNIAKVHDAGATPDRRPFFVMELVKGVPITRYCDEHRLTPKQRLELFMPVCQAIQHAHQKGIIHRDIKPSNVLVALYDGKPVPKVIDFGIAKATGQQLTERTLVTGLGTVVGTLEYMSPEQAGMNPLDIDTRSDIYALGVLLYELLTGSTPLEKKRLKAAAMLEVLRLIREEEPPRPSTRLSSTDELPSVAANRGLEPKKLSGLVRGELDWIVMKALDKDRSRRYETANGFAADVQRYLADEPVQACPPSAWYRCGKFARRHKMGLAMTGLVLCLLASLVGGIGWAVRDRAARQAKVVNDLDLALERGELFQRDGKPVEAQAALERAEQLAVEASADPARRERLGALKERLEAEARDQVFLSRYEDIWLRVESQVNLEASRFTQEAAYPEIREALGRYGIAIGVLAPADVAARVQGRPEPVRRNLLAALDECLRLAPKDDAQTRHWLLRALAAADNDAWRTRARQAQVARDWQALEQLAREADERKQPPSFLLLVAISLPAQMGPTRLDLLRRTQRSYPADLWANQRLAYELKGTGQPAEAIRYYTAALALRPDNPGVYLNRGNALRRAGEVDAAIVDHQKAIALAPGYSTAHNNLGLALQDKGQLDEAIAAFREAIRLKRDDAAPHYNLGNVLQAKGQLDEAIAAFREAIRLRKDFAEAHYNLGNALKAKGQLDEAIVAYREAIRLKKDYPEAHNNLGNALTTKGQLDKAIAAFREAIRLKKDDAKAHNNLGNALQARGQWDEAIAAFREAIRLKRDDPALHYNLGVALQDKGQLDDAIAAYREAIRLRKDYAKPHNNLGTILQAKGQLDEAIAAYREAIRLRKDYADAYCNLGDALRRQGEFRQALEELRRGHELGSRNPRWRYPSAQWVRQCERLVELDGRLPGFLEGKITPASATEQIELAELCSVKRLHRAAVRFYEEAFAPEPKLGDAHRYDAARDAALAGCGQGKDADPIDGTERTRLRSQALAWLRADLEVQGHLLDKEPAPSAATVTKGLQKWLADPAFACVRGPKALARLSESERQPWQQLWDDVADTLARAQRKSTPEKKSGTK
jgi:tetratricopeptide (TPR) repeat protein